jgi:hypothetical protein
MKFEKFLNKNKCHANINKSLENVKSKENGSQFWTVTHVSLSRICVNYSFGNPSLRQVHAEHESHVASHVKKGGQHLGLLVVDISDSMAERERRGGGGHQWQSQVPCGRCEVAVRAPPLSGQISADSGNGAHYRG